VSGARAASRPEGQAQPATRLPRRLDRARQVLLLLALVAYGLFLAVDETGMLLLLVNSPANDFYDYWSGAQSLVEGRELYGWLAVPRPAGRPLEYVYPPPLALLLAGPAAVLDFPTARVLWLAFSALCLVLALRLIWQRWARDDADHQRLVAAVWLPLLPATTWALGIGQLSPQLLLLFAGAYAALSARRPILAGCLLALGAAIKVFPAFVGGYLLLRHNWRAAIGGVVCGVSIVALTALVVGWEPYRTYLTEVVPAQRRIFAAPFNVSVVGFFTRLLAENPYTKPVVGASGAATAAVALCTTALLVATAYGVWQDRLAADGAASYALVVTATLLVAPINGRYNLVIALLPLAVAANGAQARWPHGRAWLLLAAVLLSLPVELYDLWPVRYFYAVQFPTLDLTELPWRQGWGNLLTAGPLLGLLVLWAVLLRQCSVPLPGAGTGQRRLAGDGLAA